MKILIVEDDLEISKLLADFLQGNGYEMSKENAEQLLNSVMQDEKDVQDKVKKQYVWKKKIPQLMRGINF